MTKAEKDLQTIRHKLTEWEWKVALAIFKIPPGRLITYRSLIAPRGPRFNAPVSERPCRDLLSVLASTTQDVGANAVRIPRRRGLHQITRRMPVARHGLNLRVARPNCQSSADSPQRQRRLSKAVT